MCNKHHDHDCGCEGRQEILVGNTAFKYELNQINENTYDLVATPCNIPTSVYCIARISVRENCCNNMEYYQAFINTDPVVIIQDCNLCDIIARAIATYFDNTPTIHTDNQCCNRRNSFGFF